MSGGGVAAVDLGATSGRVILGRVSANELSLRQLARFPNDPVRFADGLHWDLPGLYRGILAGLRTAFTEEPRLASIGIDAWAVDYGLLAGERLLGLPFHYRDERTAAGVAATHAIVPFEELYRRNGLQFLPFNTLYQLAAERGAGVVDAADAVLLVPDLIAFELSGARVAERTNASTTGLLEVSTGEWDAGLMRRLGLRAELFPPLVDPGERIGALRPELVSALGAPGAVPLVAVGSHDTASAVVGVPMAGDAAYISCGTWGLVGVELDAPVTTDAAREANFTNEGGVDGRVRFLHNVMGLWVLSETVRQWERADAAELDLAALLDAAAAVTAPVAVFDVDDPRFLPPGDMPARIAAWCAEHGVAAPASRAEIVRSIVESLAEAFARAVRTASALSGARVDAIHLVGGGSRNALLCQATADRSGLPVLAGPVEATAIGNVLVQARAAGFASGDLESLRALVARSFPPTRYAPR